MSTSDVYYDQDFIDNLTTFNSYGPCMCCFIPSNVKRTELEGPSGPPDAERLSEGEARFYIENLQGKVGRVRFRVLLLYNQHVIN